MCIQLHALKSGWYIVYIEGSKFINSKTYCISFSEEQLCLQESYCGWAWLSYSPNFGVNAKEIHDKVPMLYRLPKLHQNPCGRIIAIANLSSCMEKELSKIVNLMCNFYQSLFLGTLFEAHERFGKNIYRSFKNTGKVLDKLKAMDYNATSCLHMIFLLFTLLHLIV